MDNQKQILKISYELGLSHIGSCLSVLPILEEIYKKKKPKDVVVLDNAHSHLSHLVVKGNEGGSEDVVEIDIKRIIQKDIHCNRASGCDASGGSLGHGLGIGIGYALANRNRDVYIVTSDGAMNEGSNWEALRIKRQLKLDNLKIYVNWNGFTATDKSDAELIQGMIWASNQDISMPHTNNGISFLNGVNGHYDVLTKETYEQAIKEIDDNERIARELT